LFPIEEEPTEEIKPLKKSNRRTTTNSNKNKLPKIKIETKTELEELEDQEEYQCYYCGEMITSIKLVKDHMRQKHRRFHSKMYGPPRPLR
jgi:hypothetical protein